MSPNCTGSSDNQIPRPSSSLYLLLGRHLVQAGIVSNWMHQNLVENDLVTFRGFGGEFTLQQLPNGSPVAGAKLGNASQVESI